MDWNSWVGKRIFVKLRNGSVYSGEVLEVDSELKPIVFITIKDKFNQTVTFVNSEVVKIKEERL